VGTLEPRKNLENLVQAYRAFLDLPEVRSRPAGEVPQLQLIGGKGWKDSGLRRLMAPLVEAGQLKVLDYCGIEGLWESYGAACGLLFPSLHEGFGFPILEAMAAGLPVMTAARGAMAEVAGDHALLVDPKMCRQWPGPWSAWPGIRNCGAAFPDPDQSTLGAGVGSKRPWPLAVFTRS
jgi:glycosyltransferase involved in cell wall biosynthesis